MTPSIIAHRGASGVEVENSLSAFRRAATLGADGVELDVHATRDGHLVVHHDAELALSGPIADLPLATIRQARLPNGEQIPTLAEALAVLRGLDVWIELKSLPASLDELVLNALGAGPEPGRYAVHSFDHRIVSRLHVRQASLQIGVLSASYPLDPLAAARAAGATTLWQEWPLIDAELMEAASGCGIRVIAWTVPEHAAQQLARLGVAGLCGNFPDRLRDVVTPAGAP